MQKLSLFKAVTFVTAFFIPLVLSALSFGVSAATSKQSLELRIQHLEELNQTRNKVQADFSFQLSQLQAEIRMLTGLVEENQFKLKQIQDRQRDLYRDIENRFSGLSRSSGNINNRNSNRSSSKKKQSTVITKKPTAGIKTSNIQKNNQNSSASSGARREFDAAFSLVRNKNYTAAIEAFKAFLIKHPNSNYSANARYWMGQVFLVQKNTEAAEKQFALLIEEFPKASKTPQAKLKLADIFFKQEKWNEAKSYYSDVAKNYSGAQQQLARKGLTKLKQAGH